MMRVGDTYVDVKGPLVYVVIRYRSWDEASAEWTDLYKEHHTQFGPVDMDNIEAARRYVRTFRIGAKE